MEVILKKNIDKLGKAFTIVNVKNGYARNYLFPKDLAMPATKGNLKQLTRLRKNEERKKDHQLYVLKVLDEKLNEFIAAGKPAKFAERASDEGHLYGSITAQMVVDKLDKYGIAIDKKYINIEKPIKNLGENTILIEIGDEKKYDLPIIVEKLED